MNSLTSNIQAIQDQIKRACQKVGRNPESVQLIAVSKTMPLDLIQQAVDFGLTDFGENRMEEAALKMQTLPQVRWHMLGHIQSRKAAEVINLNFSLIHSVDTVKLATRLSRFAQEANLIQPILLEINISGEASKSGFSAANWEAHTDQLWGEIETVLNLPNLAVQGLMTMAPYEAEPEDTRPVFRALVALRDALRQDFPASQWDELSMGMTNDFVVAIEEGATYVRVGRAIFGERS